METGEPPGPCRLSRCWWRNVSVSVSRRFWWEKEGVFTKAQRERLRSVSLSRIICDNSHIARVPADPFSHTGKVEDTLPCSHPRIPHLDLQPWKEPDSGEEGPPPHQQVSPLCFPSSASLPDPRCGPIPRIQSGYWLLCDSVVLYQCQTGFRLSGSSSASCDPVSRQWSSRPPMCRGRGGGRRPLASNKRDPKQRQSPLRMSPVADINECEEQTSVCPENFECLNVPGSFTCSGLLRPFDLIFDLIWINGALLVLSRSLAAGGRLRGGRSDGGVWWGGRTPAAGLLLSQVRPSTDNTSSPLKRTTGN